MKIPKVGKDQLADRYDPIIDSLDEPMRVQAFTEEVLDRNNIFIYTLSMDFDPSVSAKERKAISEGWISKFPTLSHVKQLEVRHRVRQDYFEAICEMEQLESLNIWTSTVQDIGSIKKLSKLKKLTLSNFSRLTDLSPLLELRALESLSIAASFKVSDYGLIGDMASLRSLTLGGDYFAPRNLAISSLKPFTKLDQLEVLDLSSTSIKDRDYSPLLDLQKLKRLDASWRMKKEEREKIIKEHPSLQSGFFVAYDFIKNEFKDGIEWWIA